MLKIFRSAVSHRIASGFVLGAAAMMVFSPVDNDVQKVPVAVPTLAPLSE